MRLNVCLALLATLTFSCPVSASPDQFGKCMLPAGYYRIATSAEDSALYLRSEPRLESRRIGMLDRSSIVLSVGERVVQDGIAWQSARVVQTEGWVEARSLWRALPLTLDDTGFPVSGHCGDFEPLWAASWQGHHFRLSFFPGKHDISGAHVQAGEGPNTVLVTGSSGIASMKFIYSDALCFDPQGKVQGWGRANLILREGVSERLYSGCCETGIEAFAKH